MQQPTYSPLNIRQIAEAKNIIKKELIMNQVFKQHTQNVENLYKFSKCASVFKLAKLNSKSQHIRSIKSDRTPKRKEQLNKIMMNQYNLIVPL